MVDFIETAGAPVGTGPSLSYLIGSKMCSVPLYMTQAHGDRLKHALETRAFDGPRGQAAEVMGSKFIGTYDPRMRFRVTEDGVALVSIQGMLIDRGAWLGDLYGLATSYEGLAQQFASLAKDSAIKGVVLDIDSGGGMVAGLWDLCEEMGKLRKEKPVYSLAANMAASAAYALACAADEVYVTRSGYAGSIGVIMIHQSYGRMLDKMGVDTTIICEPSPKADGNPFSPLSHGARAEMSSEISSSYQTFVAHVAKYRGMKEADVVATQARMFTGEAAVEAGLADDVKSIDELLSHIRKGSKASRSRASGYRRGSTAKGGAQMGKHTTPDEGTDYDAMIADAMKAIADNQATMASAFASLSAKPAAAEAAAPAAAAPAAAPAPAAAAPAAEDPRARIKAILGHDESKKRPGLAQHLAFETDLTTAQAEAILKASPVEASDGPRQFYAAVAAAGGAPGVRHDAKGDPGPNDRVQANIERQKARLTKKG